MTEKQIRASSEQTTKPTFIAYLKNSLVSFVFVITSLFELQFQDSFNNVKWQDVIIYMKQMYSTHSVALSP